MPPVEFEPTISAGERPQTHALDRAAAGTGGNTGLFEMIVGVLTTYHTQYTWRSICIFLFNRTTLPSFCYIPYRCSIYAPFVILQTLTR